MEINLFDPDIVADPYPHYEEVRARGRVVRNDLMGLWMVPGHEDIFQMRRDYERFSMRVFAPEEATPWFGGADNMINVDPPEHTRLRKVMSRAFTRRSIETFEPRIVEIVDDLLDQTLSEARSGTVNLVSSFSRPLPTIVICELLGIPVEDRKEFNAWTDDMIAYLNIAADATDRGARFEQAKRAGVEMRRYLQAEIERHRREEHDDLIGALVEANEGGIMSDAELQATAMLLLIAGNDTTGKTLSAGVELLHRFPDERHRLVEDPSLVPNAVEEILRYEGPAQGSARLVTQDTEFAGVELQAGDIVWMLNGAGNRDAAVFPDPWRFDVARSSNHHLAFGHGIHVCLGAPLARMELRNALDRFCRRVPDYRVADLHFSPSFTVRGYDYVGFEPLPQHVAA